MSIVYEDIIKKDISSSCFAKVYLIFGDDLYLKKYYCDRISDKAYDGDPLFNLQKFEGESNLQDVYDAVNQFPMMANSKCVTLVDFDFEHCSKSDFDMLCELVSGVEEGCVFILRFDAINFDYKKSAKAKRLIDAAEKCGGRIACLDHRSHDSLARTLISGASQRGCVLNDSNAHYLIETVGDDLCLLKNELDKLCGYVKTGIIDKDTIKTVSVKSTESSVYDYVREIIDGNISVALKLLDDLFYMRVEPMMILHTASSAYVDIYRIYAANKANLSQDVIVKDFGYKNRAFVLKRASANLKKLDFKKLALSFDALLVADEHLKSFGYDPRTVLEELTVKLIYIIVKGEAVDQT